MENRTTQKPNLLVQFAKSKAEAQNAGKKSGLLGGSPFSRFPRPENDRRSTKRSGRNGQGKPS